MTFRLYSAASGGTPLWEETWTGPNSVQVSDGLFNVMLGSLSAIPQAVVAGRLRGESMEEDMRKPTTDKADDKSTRWINL